MNTMFGRSAAADPRAMGNGASDNHPTISKNHRFTARLPTSEEVIAYHDSKESSGGWGKAQRAPDFQVFASGARCALPQPPSAGVLIHRPSARAHELDRIRHAVAAGGVP